MPVALQNRSSSESYVTEKKSDREMTDPNNNQGSFHYAIVEGSQDRTYDCGGIGDAPVYAVSNGRLAAVVSDLDGAKLRPERRHLGAHQQVLKKLMEETTPLPMTFGIIAANAEEIRRILSKNQEALLEQLQRVADKVEMGLRVCWDVPNIFEYFVFVHPELRVARDRLFSACLEPTPADKVELGRTFDRILQADREEQTQKVEAILSACCFELKRNSPKNEREVMKLACLVGRRSLADFDAGVFEAARVFDNHFAFNYNGPWAPHNFVELNLSL